MPYFKWKGITLEGILEKDCSRSGSRALLEQELLQRDIALLAVQQINHWSFFNPIKYEHKITFFRHLALLLDAGIFLDQALSLVRLHITHKPFGELIEDTQQYVAQGLSLSYGLAQYPAVFDLIHFTLVQAGHDSGNLSKALLMLADHLQAREEFYKKLRSAALLPSITFLFFLGVSITILTMIVPSFVSMFNTLNRPLPTSTQWLISLSSLLTQKGMIVLGVLVFFVFMLRKMYEHTKIKLFVDSLFMRLPVLGQLSQKIVIMYWLQSLGLLLQHGVHIVTALNSITPCVSNEALKNQLHSFAQQIDKGNSLNATAQSMPSLFTPELCAIIAVGEESGKLGIMFLKAADVYKKNIERTLLYISTIFQPALMIILGLLIVGLIISVYVPIFDMSYAIA